MFVYAGHTNIHYDLDDSLSHFDPNDCVIIDITGHKVGMGQATIILDGNAFDHISERFKDELEQIATELQTRNRKDLVIGLLKNKKISIVIEKHIL